MQLSHAFYPQFRSPSNGLTYGQNVSFRTYLRNVKGRTTISYFFHMIGIETGQGSQSSSFVLIRLAYPIHSPSPGAFPNFGAESVDVFVLLLLASRLNRSHLHEYGQQGKPIGKLTIYLLHNLPMV